MAEATVLDRDERLRAADYQFLQLTEAYNDMQENYEILRTETQAEGAKQHLGVGGGCGKLCCMCVCVCVCALCSLRKSQVFA